MSSTSTTEMTEATRDAIRAATTKEFDAERREIEAKLKTTLRLEKEVAKEDERLSNAYWKLAKKNLDGEPTQKEQEAQRHADTAHKALKGAWGRIATLRRQLDQLSDAELERRIQERIGTTVRVNALRRTKGATTMAGTTTRKRAAKVEVPTDLRKRIAKLVREGNGVSAVAKILNDEKVKRPASGKADWYARAVYNIATKELGVDDLKSVREKKPLLSRAVKDNPPRSTATLPKKNGNGKPAATKPPAKADVKPDPKDKQAAGTSRGGTGTRKSTARKSSTATKRVARKRASGSNGK